MRSHFLLFLVRSCHVRQFSASISELRNGVLGHFTFNSNSLVARLGTYDETFTVNQATLEGQKSIWFHDTIWILNASSLFCVILTFSLYSTRWIWIRTAQIDCEIFQKISVHLACSPWKISHCERNRKRCCEEECKCKAKRVCLVIYPLWMVGGRENGEVMLSHKAFGRGKSFSFERRRGEYTVRVERHKNARQRKAEQTTSMTTTKLSRNRSRAISSCTCGCCGSLSRSRLKMSEFFVFYQKIDLIFGERFIFDVFRASYRCVVPRMNAAKMNDKFSWTTSVLFFFFDNRKTATFFS